MAMVAALVVVVTTAVVVVTGATVAAMPTVAPAVMRAVVVYIARLVMSHQAQRVRWQVHVAV